MAKVKNNLAIEFKKEFVIGLWTDFILFTILDVIAVCVGLFSLGKEMHLSFSIIVYGGVVISSLYFLWFYILGMISRLKQNRARLSPVLEADSTKENETSQDKNIMENLWYDALTLEALRGLPQAEYINEPNCDDI